MAKKKTLFECQYCGETSTKWLGKCPNCGGWDSFIELNQEQINLIAKQKPNTISKALPITDIKKDEFSRFSTNDEEFNLVLGGGIVKGSLILIGGSPGIGKSTLLLKTASNLAKQNKKILYVSGEESAGQIKLRAEKIKANEKNLYLLAETNLENILGEIDKSYEVIIIDSIQTIYSQELNSAAGSVSQVREITFKLTQLAKSNQIAIFIVGHITKEGSIAGPRVLEHMVDTVLYFEGESSKDIRFLRSFKNRFGSTSEIGIFEMTNEGLISAKNIAKKFFSSTKKVAGSCLSVTIEGSRALIIEVQALVAPTSYPNPKRSATGFEQNRLNMLIALLEKKLDLPLNVYDIYINISGGIKIKESGCDLAVITAIVSSLQNRIINKENVFIGEVSLTGEIREVFNLDTRLKEANSLNIKKAIIPNKSSLKLNLKEFVIQDVSTLLEYF
jgi:DNA repair protein RadA/Sms